jgi:hypothetical protein
MSCAENVSTLPKIILYGPGPRIDHDIDCKRVMENNIFDIINVYLSAGFLQAEKFANICTLNQSLVTMVKNMGASKPIDNSWNKECELVKQILLSWINSSRFENLCIFRLESWLHKCNFQLVFRVQGLGL